MQNKQVIMSIHAVKATSMWVGK